MRVVVAPDSFGGTLSAVEAVAAIAAGWSRVAPGDEVVAIPMSDGGPGFVDVLASQVAGGELRAATVTGPLGRPTAADVLIDPATGTAYVETAQAAGLHLVARRERDPMRATTVGVGELICHALDAGARTVVVGLGGSATTDGGAGALSALGLRVLGTWLAPAGVDGSGLDPRLHTSPAGRCHRRRQPVVRAVRRGGGLWTAEGGHPGSGARAGRGPRALGRGSCS